MNLHLRRLFLFALAFLVGGCGAMDDASMPHDFELLLTQDPAAAIKVGQRVTIEAAIRNNYGLLVDYDWRLVSPAGVELPFERPDDASITFTPAEPGAYGVSCTARVEGRGPQTKTLSIDVSGAAIVPTTYLVELTPPDGSGVLPHRGTLLVAGEDKSLRFSLVEARHVALEVTHEGQALGCTVLVRDELDNQTQLHLPAGVGQVSVGGAARVVVIPDASWLPPRLVRVEASSSSAKLQVEDSEVISVGGSVRAGGVPLEGAKVALYALEDEITVPSTLGQSDDAGVFELAARQGAQRLVVVPPAGSSLPVAVVDAPDLSLVAPAANWVFEYDAPAVTVQGSVRDSAGAAVQGARVLLRASSLQQVGRLSAGENNYSASGRVILELSTDGTGALVAAGGGAASVPGGDYELEVIPPSTSVDGRLRIDAHIDGLNALSMQLPRRVELQGSISDTRGGASLARVELRSRSGVQQIVADTAGAFAVNLDAEQSYGLVLRPAIFDLDHAPLIETVSVTGEDHAQGWTLPRAIEVGGEVSGPSGAGVADVMVRVYRCDAGCAEAAELVNETRTAAGGRFALRLPQTLAP